MEKVLASLRKQLTDVEFAEGDTFCWSPSSLTVTYCAGTDDGAVLSLLHEAAHALLGHATYRYDLDLVMMEVAAWQKAQQLAHELGVTADEEYIQDRLDTYRDWLHQRSTCPQCTTVGMQAIDGSYPCHNCGAIWHVSSSRFCRPYRKQKSAEKTAASTKTQSKPSVFV